jgi:hypothetical protein
LRGAGYRHDCDDPSGSKSTRHSFDLGPGFGDNKTPRRITDLFANLLIGETICAV